MHGGFVSFDAQSVVPFGVALQFPTSFCPVIKSEGITMLTSKSITSKKSEELMKNVGFSRRWETVLLLLCMIEVLV